MTDPNCRRCKGRGEYLKGENLHSSAGLVPCDCADGKINPPTRPTHPLVIDRETKLARLATQDDIHRMAAICTAYDAIMRDFAEKLRMGEHLRKNLENTYGR